MTKELWEQYNVNRPIVSIDSSYFLTRMTVSYNLGFFPWNVL